MAEEKKMELIITVVNRGFSDEVMDAARAAGAGGGTILYGRGTAAAGAQKFFGITIEPEKEVLMILTTSTQRSAIMKAIGQAAGLTTDGKGMSFSVPVDEAVGLKLLED